MGGAVNPMRDLSDCLSPSDLEDLRASSERDPRRAHVAGCPRCRALLAEYESFLAARAPASAMDFAAADARLDAFRASHIAPAAEAARAERASNARGGFAWGSLLQPLRRPLPAFAAAAAVLALVWFGPRLLGLPSGEGVLRGSNTTPPASVLTVRPAARLADGSISLSWNTVANADAYEARFYTLELEEIRRIGPFTETRLQLTPERAAELFGLKRESVLCQIVALRDGDEIARAPAFALKRP
jgi:hypothetical protein